MPSKVRITDKHELQEFVRTHLGHRLTALVTPICLTKDHPLWKGRSDVYRSAKEGSYVMLRLFIEFLGVKGPKTPPWKLTERTSLPRKDPGKDIQSTDLVLSCFSDSKGQQFQNLRRNDFDCNEERLIAEVHRTLCKINAHFTYDTKKSKPFDRIASPPDTDWEKAVEVIVAKLDEHFYRKVDQPIVVHHDLVKLFKGQFPKIKSPIKGDGLGPP